MDRFTLYWYLICKRFYEIVFYMRVRSEVMMVIQKCAYTHFNVRNVIIKHISLSYTFVRIAINILTECSLELLTQTFSWPACVYGIWITSYICFIYLSCAKQGFKCFGEWPLFLMSIYLRSINNDKDIYWHCIRLQKMMHG